MAQGKVGAALTDYVVNLEQANEHFRTKVKNVRRFYAKKEKAPKQ